MERRRSDGTESPSGGSGSRGRGQAGCETGKGADGDEIVRLPGATDAPRAARPLALPALALPPRPALARARAAAQPLVRRVGPRALAGGSASRAGADPTPARRTGRRAPGGSGPTPSGPSGTPRRAGGVGRASARSSARAACSAIASISRGHSARGRSWPMPSIIISSRAGDRARRRAPARGRDERVGACRGSRAWAR